MLALTTGQWTVLTITAAALLAIFWAARSEGRKRRAPDTPAPPAPFDADPRTELAEGAIEAETRRRNDARGTAPDLSRGPTLSKGPDLSDGPTLGR